MSSTPPSYFYSVVKLFDDAVGSRVDSFVDTASEALETASSKTLVKYPSEMQPKTTAETHSTSVLTSETDYEKIWHEEKLKLAEAFKIQVAEERRSLEEAVQKLQAEHERTLAEQLRAVQELQKKSADEELERLRAEWEMQTSQQLERLRHEYETRGSENRSATLEELDKTVEEAVTRRLEAILEEQEILKQQERKQLDNATTELESQLADKEQLISEYAAKLHETELRDAELQRELQLATESMTTLMQEKNSLEIRVSTMRNAADVEARVHELSEQIAILTKELQAKTDLLLKTERALENALEDSNRKSALLSEAEIESNSSRQQDQARLLELDRINEASAEEIQSLRERIVSLEGNQQAAGEMKQKEALAMLEEAEAHVMRLTAENESHVALINELKARLEDQQASKATDSDAMEQQQQEQIRQKDETIATLTGELESLSSRFECAIKEHSERVALDVAKMNELQLKLGAFETQQQAGEKESEMTSPRSEGVKEKVIKKRLQAEKIKWEEATRKQLADAKDALVEKHLQEMISLKDRLDRSESRADELNQVLEKQRLELEQLQQSVGVVDSVMQVQAERDEFKQALDVLRTSLDEKLEMKDKEIVEARKIQEQEFETRLAAELHAVVQSYEEKLRTAEAALKSSLSQVEAAVSDRCRVENDQQLRDLQQEHEQQLERLNVDHQEQMERIMTEQAQLKRAAEESQQQRATQHEQLQETMREQTLRNKEKYEEAMEQLRNDHSEALEDLKKQLASSPSVNTTTDDDVRIAQLEHTHEDQLRTLLEQQKTALETKQEMELESLRRTFEEEKLYLEEQLKAEKGALEMEWKNRLNQTQLAHEDALKLAAAEKQMELKELSSTLEHKLETKVRDVRKQLMEEKEVEMETKARLRDAEWSLKLQQENRELESSFKQQIAEIKFSHESQLRDLNTRMNEQLAGREAELKVEHEEELFRKEVEWKQRFERDHLESLRKKEAEWRSRTEQDLNALKEEWTSRLKQRETELKAQAEMQLRAKEEDFDRERKDRAVNTDAELQSRLKQKDAELDERLRQREAQLKEKLEEVVRKRVSREMDKWTAESRAILQEERDRITSEWSKRLEEEQQRHALELGDKIKSMKEKLEDVVKKRVSKSKDKWMEEQREELQNEMRAQEAAWKERSDEQVKRKLTREKDKWAAESRAIIQEERDRLRDEKRQLDQDWEQRFEEMSKALRDRVSSLEHMLILEQRRMDEERAQTRMKLDAADVAMRRQQQEAADRERDFVKERVALQAKFEESQMALEKEQQKQKLAMEQQDQVATTRTQHLREIETEIRLEREELARLRETNQIRVKALEEALEFERHEVAQYKNRIMEGDEQFTRERERQDELTKRLREETTRTQQLQHQVEQQQQYLDKLQRQEQARHSESKVLMERLERENKELRAELIAQSELMERVADGEAQVVQLLRAREDELYKVKQASEETQQAAERFKATVLEDCLNSLQVSKKRRVFDVWRSVAHKGRDEQHLGSSIDG